MSSTRSSSRSINSPASASTVAKASLLLALSVFARGSVHAQAVEEAQAIPLSKLEVTGTRPSEVQASTAKLPLRVLETPRAVSLVDASRLTDQNIKNADDLLNWIPGLNSNAGSYHFIARGFRMGPTDWKIDGIAGRVTNGSYSPNLFGVEQVVALKGPAGLLYGTSSAPGGQINLVSKKPKSERAITSSARIRSYGGREVAFAHHAATEFELDATGPLTADGRLLYRFLSNLEDALERPAAEDNNQFYRLTFTAKLDAAGHHQFSPLLEWSRESRATRASSISPSSSRTITDKSSAYTLQDASPRDLNLASGGRIDENLTTGFDLNSQLTDSLRSAITFRYHDRDYTNNSWAVQTATLAQSNLADPLSWTVKRRHTRARTDYQDYSLDANLTYETILSDRLSNLTQFGFNSRWNDTQSFTSTTGADQSAINLYTGTAAPLIADASTHLPLGDLVKTYEWNTYLQNQTKFAERLTVTLSAALVGDQTETIKPTGAASTVTRHSTAKPNLGLVYLLSPKAAAYTSYSTSYQLPNSTYENSSGKTGTFSPTVGENIELGLKAELWGDLVAASASLFQSELNNVLIASETGETNTQGNSFYRQLDTGRRARGLELEFTLTPRKGLTTTTTYAYIDAHERNKFGQRDGRAPMTPRHAITSYTRYQFAKVWSASLGAQWMDTRVGGQSAISSTNTDPLMLQSYYRFDTSLSRRFNNWLIALNVENVTDENYLLGGSTGLNLERANPRTYTLRVTRSW